MLPPSTLTDVPFIITIAPSSKKSFAVSKPIHLVDPDIKTFLPFKCKFIMKYLLCLPLF